MVAGNALRCPTLSIVSSTYTACHVLVHFFLCHCPYLYIYFEHMQVVCVCVCASNGFFIRVMGDAGDRSLYSISIWLCIVGHCTNSYRLTTINNRLLLWISRVVTKAQIDLEYDCMCSTRILNYAYAFDLLLRSLALFSPSPSLCISLTHTMCRRVLKSNHCMECESVHKIPHHMM